MTRTLALLPILVVFLAVACGGGDATEPTATPEPIQQPTAAPDAWAFYVDIIDFAHRDVTVPVGTTVGWANRGNVRHTTTEENELWDSKALEPGQTFSFTFTEAGTYKYFCAIHPTMRATVAVTAAEAPTPTPAPTPTRVVTAEATKAAVPAPVAESSANIVDFSHQSLTVAAGTAVTWTNQGDTIHTSTSDDDLWDSDLLETGKTFSFTFTQPGTFGYFCAIHPDMTATITVTGAGATPVPAVTQEDNALEIGDASDRVGRLGYSSDPGTLSPYIKPGEIDGSGRKLLAIYMVASDLEENDEAGTTDFQELIEGYNGLPNNQVVEVIVAFGGADKDGWRGMKFANIYQLMADAQDQRFGNETGSGAYLYQADGAHMGYDSSLTLFLDYLRDGYVNFDQKFLTFWDHGNSYKGFGNDTNFNSDPLFLDEMDQAFQRSQPGTFDLIGFDACLMATLEVANTIKSNAMYMIASEETEPGHGWLWSDVIQQYAQQDTIVEAGKRIIDNFVQDVHQYEAGGKTLSLLDLSQYDRLVTALNPAVLAFGQQLLSNDEYSDSVIFGSTRAQSYGASERENSRASIDLRHFTQLLAEKLPNSDISPSLDELMAAIDRFVVHSNQDGTRQNSFGIAIDAPENTDAEYSDYKINDTWLGFQSAYTGLLQSDTLPPVVQSSDTSADPQSLQLDPDVADQFLGSEGTVATFNDENLTKVTTIYGFLEPIEFEDGAVEEYFMIVAELEAYPTDTEGEFFTPPWDQWWFTVEYEPGEFTAWIPASFNSFFEDDGQEFTVYTAEIDYYQAGKDYSGYEFPADFATMTLIVDEFMEVVDYYIQTYKFMYSGPEDEEGTVQIDKATLEFTPGDAVQFWNFGFNLEDETKDDWFEASDVVTFVQEPFFLLEFLEFEDQFGELIEYQYAMWAEDVSGNGILTELARATLE